MTNNTVRFSQGGFYLEAGWEKGSDIPDAEQLWEMTRALWFGLGFGPVAVQDWLDGNRGNEAAAEAAAEARRWQAVLDPAATNAESSVLVVMEQKPSKQEGHDEAA
jgi:hypothetical protein